MVLRYQGFLISFSAGHLESFLHLGSRSVRKHTEGRLQKSTLALWKAKIDEFVTRDSSQRCNKRARVDNEVSYKDQCRINCGADIVVRNVLRYLLPKWGHTSNQINLVFAGGNLNNFLLTVEIFHTSLMIILLDWHKEWILCSSSRIDTRVKLTW